MQWISTIAQLVSLFGVPVALIGLWLTSRHNANARDLQVVLNLGEAFRLRWETKWRDLLIEIENTPEDERSTLGSDRRNDLDDLLNWIDWLGTIILTKMMKRPEAIFATLGPQLKRAIKLSEPFLAEDEASGGSEYWAGVRFIQRRLERHKR